MKFDLIIPCKNESSLKTLLFDIQSKCPGLNKIFIVADSANDLSLNPKSYFTSDNRFEFLVSEQSKGFFKAIEFGIKASSGDFVIVFMGDGSDNIDDINGMIQKSSMDHYEIICAERDAFNHESQIKNLLKKVFIWILRNFTTLTFFDLTNNFKLYRRETVLKLIDSKTNGFSWSFEVTVKAINNRLKIGHIPSRAFSRISGQSKFKLLEQMGPYLKWATILLLNQLWLKMDRKILSKNQRWGSDPL